MPITNNGYGPTAWMDVELLERSLKLLGVDALTKGLFRCRRCFNVKRDTLSFDHQFSALLRGCEIFERFVDFGHLNSRSDWEFLRLTRRGRRLSASLLPFGPYREWTFVPVNWEITFIQRGHWVGLLINHLHHLCSAFSPYSSEVHSFILEVTIIVLLAQESHLVISSEFEHPIQVWGEVQRYLRFEHQNHDSEDCIC